MDKKQCVLNYAQKQTPKDLSTLGFAIIKTEEHFERAYAMHDVATSHVVRKYLESRCSIHPIGVDLRKHEVIIQDELPDYLLEKNADTFCFDVKAKSSTQYFGWVNERAVLSYRKLAKACSVPVYLVFVEVVAKKITGRFGYCNIEDEPIRKKQAWNGNVVWMFNWKEGLVRL